MPDTLRLNRKKSAVVIMDFQNDILAHVIKPKGVVAKAASVLRAARKAGIPVMHVQHRGGKFAEMRPGTDTHHGVAPLPGETVITKIRNGAYSTTGLDVMLRGKGVDTLVLMGCSTRGCVLNTLSWANDIGYKVVVVKDGCADHDAEIHRVLVEELFPRAGKHHGADQLVATAAEFARAVSRP